MLEAIFLGDGGLIAPRTTSEQQEYIATPSDHAFFGSVFDGTAKPCLSSPVLRTPIHTQRYVASLYSFESIPTMDVEMNFPSLQAQPGGSQSSNINPQPYHSSPAQAHEIFSSVALASTGVDSPKCGRSHQVEVIMTNP